MKKVLSLAVTALMLTGLFTSCEKEEDPINIVPDEDIYILGMDYSNSYQGLVWKDVNLIYHEYDDVVALGAGIHTNSLFARGNDVYSAGRILGQAGIWKNGTSTYLSIEGYGCGMSGSGGSSVYVKPNGDTYVAGGICDNPALWINGELNILPGVEKAFAYSVFIHDDDVYVVGRQHLPNSKGRAVLWKNGALQILSENIQSIATQVQVAKNGDVYVLGGVENDYVYWIANKSQQFDIPMHGASSIFLKDNDLYVAGVMKGNAEYEWIASVWKEGGEVQHLSGSGQGNDAKSIVVTRNNNVYVVGTENGNAVLWKNGNAHILKENATAVSITLQR